MQEVYETYRDQADFFFIYIREAHPADGARPARHVEIDQPVSFERRREVAAMCVEDLNLTIPVLIDGMDNAASKAYDAFPDRLFILDGTGHVAYRGARGPGGFDVNEMAEALKERVAPNSG